MVGAGGADAVGDLEMGCGCGLHYSCLLRYLHDKLGDWGNLSLRGVCCPSGAQCVSFASTPAYYITLADLDNLVDYGASDEIIALLRVDDIPPLTHDKVAELRAWLEESAALEGLRVWLGDSTVTDDERRQLEGVRRGEPAFDVLVRRGADAATTAAAAAAAAVTAAAAATAAETAAETAAAAFVAATAAVAAAKTAMATAAAAAALAEEAAAAAAAAVATATVDAAAVGDQGEQPELTAELAATLRARLRPLREGYTDELDPFVAATTKACPTCSMRSTHWHGHQCHQIAPSLGIGSKGGCPSCRVHYCYRCLATEQDNVRLRGHRSACVCGYWHNFCIDIRTQEDVDSFVTYQDGIPLDSRCGCVVCPECRYREPCASCTGNCGVCRGFLNPAPDQANPPSKWVALTSWRGVTSRLRRACKQGDAAALAAALAEAGERATGLANEQDRNDRTCLMHACEGGHAECVALLLAVSGIDVNQVTHRGNSALHLTARGNNPACVSLLLHAPGIQVNHTNNEGYSAMGKCMHRLCPRSLECLRLLLAFPGIDANDALKARLRISCHEGDAAALAAALAEAGERATGLANEQDRDDRTCLMHACEGGHAECVALLLAVSGIDVNHADRVGESALSYCSRAGRTSCVAALLGHARIDVNLLSEGREESALLNGSRYGHVDVVRLLLSHRDIDVNSSGIDGENALMMCSKVDGDPELMRLLLAHPAIEINRKNTHGESALTASARGCQRANVDLLLSRPDVDVGDALHARLLMACYEVHVEALSAVLVDAGPASAETVNRLDVQRRSCLHYLHWRAGAMDGNFRLDCLRVLLAVQGIDVNIVDKFGWSVLREFCHRGSCESVAVLLAHPSFNINQISPGDSLTEGRLALIVSSARGHHECVKVLGAQTSLDATDRRMARMWTSCQTGDAEALAAAVAEVGGDMQQLQLKRDWGVAACLRLACSGGKADCVDVLLGIPGIDTNATDRNGETSLVKSCKKKHASCVARLLAHPGIDVNYEGPRGKRLHGPLLLSSGMGHADCVSLLLAHQDIDVRLVNQSLLEAAREGRAECLRFLLAHPGVVTIDADNEDSALILAAENGFADCVSLLLAHPAGIDVNYVDSGRSAIQASGFQGYADCVALLSAHPGIDARDALQARIWIACRDGEEAGEAGITSDMAAVAQVVNRQDLQGCTCLHVAANAGHNGCVSWLLSVPGIDVNIAANNGRGSALAQCSKKGRLECARLLLAFPGIDASDALKARLWTSSHEGDAAALAAALAEAGERATGLANEQDRDNRTCLMHACEGGHAECVALLLAVSGIDVNHADNYDVHALLLSGRAGHAPCVALLQAHKDTDAGAALQGRLLLACHEGNAEALLAVLAEAEAEAGGDMGATGGTGATGAARLVNKSDRHGRTSLQLACDRGFTDGVSILLAVEGIQLNNDREFYYSPIMSCSRNSESGCLGLLLAKPGVDLCDGHKSESALLLNCARGHAACVELLLAVPGIDVNQVDYGGESACHVSSQHGHADCLRLLLAQPLVDLTLLNDEGLSARDVACDESVRALFRGALVWDGTDLGV